MLETWVQWTCDGCGETESTPEPNTKKSDVRINLRSAGWRCFGPLDYCRDCVTSGAATRRDTGMGGG